MVVKPSRFQTFEFVRSSFLKNSSRWGEENALKCSVFVKITLFRDAVMVLGCPAAIVALFLLELNSTLFQGKLHFEFSSCLEFICSALGQDFVVCYYEDQTWLGVLI